MSDESRQSGQQSKTTSATEIGEKWSDPISRERQAELQGYLDRWESETDHGKRNGPFDEVLLTGADVFWLAEKSGRGVAGNVPNLHLEGANLRAVHLGGSYLRGAHLEGADLGFAHLEGTNLAFAQMERVDLSGARLEGTNLHRAHLERADLSTAHLERADLRDAHLERADLGDAHLEGTNLSGAHLESANLSSAQLEGATLREAHLEGADLGFAHLEGKKFAEDDPNLLRIRPWEVDFPAVLLPTDLSDAFFDDATQLRGTRLFNDDEKDKQKAGAVTVADLHWRGTNLAVVQLPPAHLLGDERMARTPNNPNDKPKLRYIRVAQFQTAVRANRQLAVALKAQGLDEDAGRFAYNAQLLQQQVLRLQRKFGAYVFSRLLDGLAGYGYKPVRGLIAYIVVIMSFAITYYLIGHTSGVIPGPVDAVVFSLTSFHGRGFFPSEKVSLHSPLIVLAALEAVTGLLIEISFIATFTQRFFGR